MPNSISLRSPAKINLTLEVLARRDDGYHEIRTILQTIALSDVVIVEPADTLSLDIAGDAALATEPPDTNLAYQAALLTQKNCGVTTGASIHLKKRIPTGAGLGGGSSNAAATLRALKSVWRLSLSSDELTELARGLGSDVPFFLSGGTALGVGRGDDISPLPDVQPQRLVLAWPETTTAGKTPTMYQSLQPDEYSDGSAADRLAAEIGSPTQLADSAIQNPFERSLSSVDANAAQAFADAHAFGQPHLAGSGPAFFFLLPPNAPVDSTIRGLNKLGLTAIETQTITSREALESA